MTQNNDLKVSTSSKGSTWGECRENLGLPIWLILN